MVGTLTSIYRGEESLSIQGICARYRGHPGRARWEQNNRSVAQAAEYFSGRARAIGAVPEKDWAVRCRATALRSPYRHFCLGRRLRHGIDVMQLVSYSSCSLVFTLILYRSCRAMTACYCPTRVASCFIFPDFFFPLIPFSPPSIIHCTVLCLTRSQTCTCTHTVRTTCIVLYECPL
jgi:hypothetical protein